MKQLTVLKNGAHVLKQKQGPGGVTFVAARLDNKAEKASTSWVTWAVADCGAGYWGHYFDTEAMALRDLDKRTAENSDGR